MAHFSHIQAGFTLGFRYRRELSRLLAETPQEKTTLAIDPADLKARGIAALALDFDGVLAHHGAAAPLPEAVAWMKRCEAVFGGDKIFILSNRPTDERIRWLGEHFPTMRFISAVRKKPYPDGINRTAELAGVPLSSVMMVDDRLLTGCLAALAAGANPCYIRRPYILFSHRPLAELFFLLLRIGERMFVRLSNRL